MVRNTLIGLCILVLIGCAIPQIELNNLELNIKNNKHLAVKVYNTIDGIDWTGSGFFIDENIIITNNHVISESCTIKGECFGYSKNILIGIGNNNRKVLGHVVAQENTKDMALVRLEESFNILPLEFARKVSILDNICTIHSPSGFYNIVSCGRVLGTSVKTSLHAARNVDGFAHTAIIQGGSSGSILFNADNEIVGMNFSEAGKISIAVPAYQIKEFIRTAQELMEKK